MEVNFYRQNILWSEHMDDSPLPNVRTFLIVSLFVAVAGLLMIPFDHAIVAWINSHSIGHKSRAFLSRAEPFGHGYGILLILVTWIILCRPTIRRFSAVAASAGGAGLVANILKAFVVRTRPNPLPENSVDTLLSFMDPTASPISAFAKHVGDDAHLSFPSAHTATAFGFALALGHLFPRGRIWFLFLGLLVGCQRINEGRHYPGDVFCGAAIGIAVGTVVMWHLAVNEPRGQLQLWPGKGVLSRFEKDCR